MPKVCHNSIMSDPLELQQDRKQIKEELDNEAITPGYGLPPTPEEVNVVNFTEQSKKVATEIENQTASKALQVNEIKQKVVEDIVADQKEEINLDTKISAPDNIEELRAAQAQIGDEVTKKVKEALGHNPGVAQAEARLEAWRKRDINKEIEINQQIKAKEREEKKSPSKTRLKEDQDKEKSVIKKALDGPSLIELLVNRILEVLGLKPKPEVPQEEDKDEDRKSGRSRRRKEQEPLMKRILRAIGLIP